MVLNSYVMTPHFLPCHVQGQLKAQDQNITGPPKATVGSEDTLEAGQGVDVV